MTALSAMVPPTGRVLLIKVCNLLCCLSYLPFYMSYFNSSCNLSNTICMCFFNTLNAFFFFFSVSKLLSKSERKHSSSTIPPTTTSSNTLHMVSIGHDTMILEFWVDTKNGKSFRFSNYVNSSNSSNILIVSLILFVGNLTIKLSRPDQESNKVLGETVVEGCLPLHQWNHVAMNIKETMQKRKILVEVRYLDLNANYCLKFQLTTQVSWIHICASRCCRLAE